MLSYTAPGWYGKLPSAGDFLRRRLNDKKVNYWNHWFQQGLLNWEEQEQANTALFLRAPAWNFILPVTPRVQKIQMGCLLPSCDRVGRAWPLIAVRPFPLDGWHPYQLRLAGDWFDNVGSTLLFAIQHQQSPQELEIALQSLPPLMMPSHQQSDIMDVIGYRDLPCTISWEEAANCFDPQQPISYWWSNRSDGFTRATHKHSGNLTAQLFSLLFNPAAGDQPGRNGLWPPMFE